MELNMHYTGFRRERLSRQPCLPSTYVDAWEKNLKEGDTFWVSATLLSSSNILHLVSCTGVQVYRSIIKTGGQIYNTKLWVSDNPAWNVLLGLGLKWSNE